MVLNVQNAFKSKKMTTEKATEINNLVEKILKNLNSSDLELAKSLCRGAYNMGFDEGKTQSTLEIIGADEFIKNLDK